MRKIILLGLLAAVGYTTSCTTKTKEEPCTELTMSAPQVEVDRLKQFIDTNQIDATLDSRGFYYKIHNLGQDQKPSQCSKVVIDYTGKFTSGQQFDGNVNSTFLLENTVPGFRMGLPLIAAGGEITLFLPPSLGYGSEDSNGIPGGSILIFRIKLSSFTQK